MAATPRPAATLVLMRDGAGGHDGPQVLMVERHRDSVVGAGAFVFPGGILEPQDYSEEAIGLLKDFASSQAAERPEHDESPEVPLGFFLAAIRETFEETLVLLAKTAIGCRGKCMRTFSLETLDAIRREIIRGERGFYTWLTELGWRPTLEELVYFAHWITPEANPNRFSTRFFLARVPKKAEVVPDSAEISGHLWVAPEEALQRHQAGQLHLMAPTIKNLELLAGFSSTDQALACLTGKAVTTIQPKLIFAQDGSRRVVYPWDSDYVDG